MSYQSYINAVTSFLIFGGILLFNYADGSPTLPPTSAQGGSQLLENMAGENSIEVDGLQFETITSNYEIDGCNGFMNIQNTFQIPKLLHKYSGELKYSYGTTTFYMALCVRNKTDKPIRFGRFGIIKISVIEPDGKELAQSGEIELFNAIEYGSVLLNPGESTVVPWQGQIGWLDEQLVLGFNGCPGCPIGFQDVKAGRYQLQVTYSNSTDEIDTSRSRFSKTPPEVKAIVWKGEATIPAIELQLTQ